MFLQFNRRFKDGKEHRYWNIVESKRCAGGRVVQRQVLYLGEINDSQQRDWCRAIDNGARAGWRVNFMSSLGWIASGRSACPLHAKVRGNVEGGDCS